MIKPDQITSVKFTPVSAGTYSAEEVDAFVQEVAAAYGEVVNQNTTLMKKMSILAEKVESYRNDEDAIKSALLDAHKMAENVTKTADAKAQETISAADIKAQAVTAEAEKKAAEIQEAARLEAGNTVQNARTAVASLTERAQAEADKVVAEATKKADEIIANANKEGDAIIGNSKKEYNFYTTELEKVKAEIVKFKSMVNELKIEESVAAAALYTEEEINAHVYTPVVETVAEPVAEVVAPVVEEAAEPVVPFETPAEEEEAPVVEEASFDDDDDFQDLYDLLDEGEDAPAVDFVANMETVVPDFNQALAEEEPQIPAAQAEPEIPSVPVFEAPAAEEEETVDDMDEFLNSLDIDEGDSDDDEDISSLFDSLFD